MAGPDKEQERLEAADQKREQLQAQADAEEMTANYLTAYPAINDIYTLCGRDIHITLSYLNDSVSGDSLRRVREYANKKL